MAEKRLHAFVYGLVQGVGFRYSTKQAAKTLSLKGFVKNLQNESVEVVAEGKEEALNEFLKQLEKGYGIARVDKVKASWNSPKKEFEDFTVEHGP